MKSFIRRVFTVTALVVAGPVLASTVADEVMFASWQNNDQINIEKVVQRYDFDQAGVDPNEVLLWTHPKQGQMSENPQAHIDEARS